MPLLAEVFPPVRDVAAIGIAAWFLIRLARQERENLHVRAKAQGSDFDETAAAAIGKSVTAAIVVIAALVMLQTLGFRSEARRVGQECVRTGSSRWSPVH